MTRSDRISRTISKSLSEFQKVLKEMASDRNETDARSSTDQIREVQEIDLSA